MLLGKGCSFGRQPNRDNPVSDISSADFGRVLSFSSSPRILQFALKFTFWYQRALRAGSPQDIAMACPGTGPSLPYNWPQRLWTISR